MKRRANLQIPPSRYAAAERAYNSVGTWLGRQESTLRSARPEVYVQGSFRLGTAIRPASETEDYDVDLVCELALSKSAVTQATVKARLGAELSAYARAHGMASPDEGRRCWTQHYADTSQFHIDTLPAVPDGQRQQLLLEQRGFSSEWAGTAIAITDTEHLAFRRLTQDWPHSNPKGYATWFRSRMRDIFDITRQILALKESARVDDIPEYRVRTALQTSVQLLKRHRDMLFVDREGDKPISIIITTLAAHVYSQQTNTAEALYAILDRLDEYIENREGVTWIPNPTDPRENFADRWTTYPQRRDAFYEWLTQARLDFGLASRASTKEAAAVALEPRFGKRLVESSETERRALTSSGPIRFLSPAHREPLRWRRSPVGVVWVDTALVKKNDGRWTVLKSNHGILPKRCSLRFTAKTDIPQPYSVYWQVVNTGPEAIAAQSLRGGYDESPGGSDQLIREESTLYTGTHSIECFVVRYGFVVAESGQFIVNIE